MQLMHVDPAIGFRYGNGCDQLWFITAQSGGAFSGTYAARGHSLDSDKTCGYSGTVTGTVAPDGALTLRLDPLVYYRGCTRVSGGDTFVGTFNSETTILQAEVTDLVTCEEIVGTQRAGTYQRKTTLLIYLKDPNGAPPAVG